MTAMSRKLHYSCVSRISGRSASRVGRSDRTIRAPASAVGALGESESVLQLAELRQASEPAELRATAFLRAASFHEFNPERSKFAQEAHRRMKADAEWQELEQKLVGSAPGWKDTTVVPLLMLVPKITSDACVQAVLKETADLSAQLPPAKAGEHAMLPIATLDLNIGISLPAEELVGNLPKDDAKTRRGYLSNVCVSSGARKQGLARRLVAAAEALAKERGVSHMYVHVVVGNKAAQALYSACGFEVEREESADAARKRQHGRRLLLRKEL